MRVAGTGSGDVVLDGTGQSASRVRRAVSGYRAYAGLDRYRIRFFSFESVRGGGVEDAGISEGRIPGDRADAVRRRSDANVQYGEFLWWYFAGPNGGMAYYDDETMAAAQTALGRALSPYSIRRTTIRR